MVVALWLAKKRRNGRDQHQSHIFLRPGSLEAVWRQALRPQANGLGAILDNWERDRAKQDDRWLAYALATTYHETAFTMQPINEKGGPMYFFSMYDKDGDRPKVAARLGNTAKGDGVRFHGRGYVQLTGRTNYRKAGRLVEADLLNDANLALDPTIAGKILFTGMETGLFTTKKFGDYFNKSTEDWINARRIINGLDKAPHIADYGRKFYGAISYTTGP
jgi:putative chitinase